MADKTAIQWTDATWNPIRGCSRVSEGCRHCYAEAFGHRFSKEGQPFHGLVKGGKWTGLVDLVPSVLDLPLRWTKPRMVFVNSLSDLFHPAAMRRPGGAGYTTGLLGIMAAAHRHTFQALTKRPEEAKELLQLVGGMIHPVPHLLRSAGHLATMGLDPDRARKARRTIGQAMRLATRWPLPNVWLGVSVEDQQTAQKRIPVLLDTPAALRWISLEPQLGPVDLRPWLTPMAWSPDQSPDGTGEIRTRPGLDWVVLGGESGRGARPFDLAWARQVVSDCIAAGVPVFVKQLGAVPVEAGKPLHYFQHPKGGDPAEWPPSLQVRQWPQRRDP